MGWALVVTTVINLNVARFLNILIVTSIVNCTRTDTKISKKMQSVMWISGLRGAMAYALALKCATDLAIGPVILIDTLLYALFTILGIGSILNPILERLGVKRNAADDAAEELTERMNEANGNVPRNCCSKLKKRIRHFDNETFSPLFIKDVKNIQRRNLNESFSDGPAGGSQGGDFAFN